MESWYKRTADIITLKIYVQPGAKHTKITGIHNHALKIKLTASPIEGRANKTLLHYIAELFDVPLYQVTLTRGEKSRHKIIEIHASRIDPESIINI